MHALVALGEPDATQLDQRGLEARPARVDEADPRKEEIQHRTWICPCDDMQIYKYCHCLLFVNEEGKPITEHLPEHHEGRAIHGIVPDPTPDRGRALRDKAEEREKERRERPS